jgi:hypothetical protein
MVATVLFATLAITNPEAARVFASLVEHVTHAGAPLPAAQRAVIQDDIVLAFRAAFLMMAMFTSAGCLLALSNPLRRI